MKIGYCETTHHEAEITLEEQLRITMATLREVYEIPERAYFDGNKLMKLVEYAGGSHSWDDEEFVKQANETDRRIVDLLKDLHEKWRKERFGE